MCAMGRCVMLGVPSTSKLEIDYAVMTAGCSIEYVIEGDSIPDILIPKLGIVKLRQIPTIFRRARPTPGPQINKLAVVLDGETANKFSKLTIP